MSIRKNIASLSVVALFACIAIASKTNKIHYGAFYYNNMVESNTDTVDYLLKNDGTKIYGSIIKWQSGAFTKDKIQIDDQTFPISEIKAYRNNKVYFARWKKEYIKRIVHGKINVYVAFSEQAISSMPSSNTNIRPTVSYYTRTDHFAQFGDDGPLVNFAGSDDIKNLLKDCPISVEMVDKSHSKLNREIKANSNYLNQVFEIYNNDCKPLK